MFITVENVFVQSTLPLYTKKVFLYLVLFIVTSHYVFGKQLSLPINDLSIHQYTTDGEVAQIVYAAKSVEKLSSCVCFIDKKSKIGVLIICNQVESPLLIPRKANSMISNSPNQKLIWSIIGHPADSRYLSKQLNIIIHENKLIYGEFPSPENLSRQLAVWMTRGMYPREVEDPIGRPLACKVIIPYYSVEKKNIQILIADNSGSVDNGPS
eukprot:gene10545-14167_t